MSCNHNCNSLCPNLIISTSVTLVTVGGTDTLLINIPTGTYQNGCKYCIVVAQSIPTTVTISTPVAISIGGDTTTVYPLVNKCCAQVTACAIRSRTRYATLVTTSATGGTFKVLNGLCCAPNNNLASLPVATTATVATQAATLQSLTSTSRAVKPKEDK